MTPGKFVHSPLQMRKQLGVAGHSMPCGEATAEPANVAAARMRIWVKRIVIRAKTLLESARRGDLSGCFEADLLVPEARTSYTFRILGRCPKLLQRFVG